MDNKESLKRHIKTLEESLEIAYKKLEQLEKNNGKANSDSNSTSCTP